MVLKKIYFSKNAVYQPGNKASSRLIRKELRDYIASLPTFIYGKKEFSFLSVICKFFNCKFKLHPVSPKSFAGSVNLIDRIISLKQFKNTKRIKRVLCHEIAHVIQYDLKLWNSKYLSEEIRMEQEAESMAYFLFKKFFPLENVGWNKFKGYFCESDLIFLCNYYKDYYINDLIVWRKKEK